MSCTCCVCAGLPLTRGFSETPSTFSPSDTKTITWADSLSVVVVVDGHGPVSMQGSNSWSSHLTHWVFPGDTGRVLSGSTVTFHGVEGPSFSFGTCLFPHLSETNLPEDIHSTSGAVSVSLFGQTVVVRYTLEIDALDDSINNPVYVDGSNEYDPPYASSATVSQQLQSQTVVTIPFGESSFSATVPSVLDLALSDSGTELQDFTERPLDNLKQLICWREQLNADDDKWNIQDSQSTVVGPTDDWPYQLQAQSPPITNGYTLKHLLEFGNQQKLLLTTYDAPYTGFGPRELFNPLAMPVSLDCVADGQPNDEQQPSSGFWTAAAFRPALLSPALQTTLQLGVTGPTGVTGPFIRGRLIEATRLNVGFVNTSNGMLFSLTRNDQQVMPPTQQPTRQQLHDATAEEGSYLLTVTPTGTYGPPSVAIPTNKDFFSFVIDRKPPVIGFAAIDDIFVGNEAPPGTVVTSTKPLLSPLCRDDESASGICARPCINIPLKQGDSTAAELSITAGEYTLRPFSEAECWDFAGNNPDEVFSQSWAVHEKHPNFRAETLAGGHSYYGAIPSIEKPGLQTREYYRARLQSEAVANLTLTFDRPVDPATVKDSHLRFFCNGMITGGCTIEQAGDTARTWLISLPTQSQQSATFCVLEYDPSGEVMTNDTFKELHFANANDFPTNPARSSELFRIVFVDDSTDKRYSVSVDPGTNAVSYVDIEDGNPLDWNGDPYDPEPSTIVARASWLMADTDGWPRLIDTNSVVHGFVIGRAASIGQDGPLQIQDNDVVIECTGDIGIAAQSQSASLLQRPFEDFGLVTTSVNYDGFIPRAPGVGETGQFSYWGIGTTIDPSPPETVPACAAPIEEQWHSSAIACDSEISAFEARIVFVNEYGSEMDPPQDVDGAYISGKVLFGQPAGGFPGWSGPPPGDFNHVAVDLFPRLCAMAGTSLPFSTTFESYDLAQNLWAGIIGSDSFEIEAMPMATTTAYFIDGTTVTSSPYWVQSSPHFVFEFESPQQTFGNSETTLEEAIAGVRFTTAELSQTESPALSGRVRSLVSARYSIDGGQTILSAFRQAKTFPAMKTTTLGPLVVKMSLRACIKAQTDYEDNEPSIEQFVREVRDENGGVVLFENMTFEDVMDSICQAVAYDAEVGAWVLPPFRWKMFCTRGNSISARTITERVLKDYTYTHTLTLDDEAALANGAEISVPLAHDNVELPYKVKLRRA